MHNSDWHPLIVCTQNCLRHSGYYYIAAWRYDISLLVSPSGHVMLYLLYKHQWNDKPFHLNSFFCCERHSLLCSHSNGVVFTSDVWIQYIMFDVYIIVSDIQWLCWNYRKNSCSSYGRKRTRYWFSSTFSKLQLRSSWVIICNPTTVSCMCHIYSNTLSLGNRSIWWLSLTYICNMVKTVSFA